MPRWRDPLAEQNRGGAAAAADIDHALTYFGFGAVDQKVGNGAQQDVLRGLPIGPALAARPVPVGDLVGVLVVALRVVHLCAPGKIWKSSGSGSCHKSGKHLVQATVPFIGHAE